MDAGDAAPRSARKLRPFSWADFLIQFRWIVVVPIILPMSFVCYEWIKWKIVFKRAIFGPTAEEKHAAAVRRIQQRVRNRRPDKDGLICTARKPWLGIAMRNAEHKRAPRFEVDIGPLNDILFIDKNQLKCRCEPMVIMSQLSNDTMKYGLAPEVLPELDDLTVGGVVNGYGIEGSSHIHGLFSDTCLAYELVLGDGRLVRATADNEFSDLFRAVPWSHGSLGLLVAVEFRLIPIQEYMELTYKPVKGTLKDIAQAYRDAFCPHDMDQDNPAKVPAFVEGIVYSKSEAVITTGQYASPEVVRMASGNVAVQKIGQWYKHSFYRHAQEALERGEFVEFIPTRQYYHRHTRSLYWEGALIVPMGDHWLFRFLLGWLMPPKVSILKLTQNDLIRNYYHHRHACQDMLVVNRHLAECLEFCHEHFETYPLWLCPHRLFRRGHGTMLDAEAGYEQRKDPGDTDDAQMWTDVGIWGVPGPVLRGEEWDGVAAVKAMEKWLTERKGYQCLYAVTEQSEKEFWSMFNPTLYNAVRVKYGAEGVFMNVYYKVSKSKKGKLSTEESTKMD